MSQENYNLGSVGNFRLLNFATGSYHCTCAICKKDFFGDKRASQCLSCAIEFVNQMEEIVNNSVKLISKWTNSAQSSCNNDDERNIYYQCAEDLHKLFNLCKKEEKNE